jgi:hypothetical protein
MVAMPAPRITRAVDSGAIGDLHASRRMCALLRRSRSAICLQEEVANVAHAVVMQVNLVGDPGEGVKMLDEVVIPQAKAQPGFQRGTWMHSKAMTGTGVMVFDTEDHASAAMEALQPPPGGPTVINCAVFEIAREA